MTCPSTLAQLELEFSTYDPWREEEESSVKNSKFSEAQIALVLKQAEDATPIGVLQVREFRTRRFTTAAKNTPA